MATKAEWNAALDEMIREDQERLGPPDQITPTMMFAYVRGQMADEEVDRVREFIAAWPAVMTLHNRVYRIHHDRFARGQFTEVRGDFRCESGGHEANRPATYRRPPMPEVMAQTEVLFCAECWAELPE